MLNLQNKPVQKLVLDITSRILTKDSNLCSLSVLFVCKFSYDMSERLDFEKVDSKVYISKPYRTVLEIIRIGPGKTTCVLRVTFYSARVEYLLLSGCHGACGHL